MEVTSVQINPTWIALFISVIVNVGVIVWRVASVNTKVEVLTALLSSLKNDNSQNTQRLNVIGERLARIEGVVNTHESHEGHET
jgi:hypothetical protein